MLSATALNIAQSQVGVCEVPKGSNAGPQVTEYLKSVGLGGGYSWCMAFVYWCTQKASQIHAVKNPLLKTGGVMLQWNSTALRKFPNRSTSSVKPGDIFIMQFGHGLGHTGFVEKIEGSIVHTIEGNTNDDGSREGYEVARRTRSITSLLGFIQLP